MTNAAISNLSKSETPSQEGPAVRAFRSMKRPSAVLTLETQVRQVRDERAGLAAELTQQQRADIARDASKPSAASAAAKQRVDAIDERIGELRQNLADARRKLQPHFEQALGPVLEDYRTELTGIAARLTAIFQDLRAVEMLALTSELNAHALVTGCPALATAADAIQWALRK